MDEPLDFSRKEFDRIHKRTKYRESEPSTEFIFNSNYSTIRFDSISITGMQQRQNLGTEYDTV
jgi:hypothetical protein